MARRRSGPKGRGPKPAAVAKRSRATPIRSVPVENNLPGTILHLGDGRRLAFGETAAVPERLAERLVAAGRALRLRSADALELKEQPA
jgi:hypothetical protein